MALRKTDRVLIDQLRVEQDRLMKLACGALRRYRLFIPAEWVMESYYLHSPSRLKGVRERMRTTLKLWRSIQKVEDLLVITGVGPKTIEKIRKARVRCHNH